LDGLYAQVCDLDATKTTVSTENSGQEDQKGYSDYDGASTLGRRWTMVLKCYEERTVMASVGMGMAIDGPYNIQMAYTKRKVEEKTGGADVMPIIESKDAGRIKNKGI